MRFSSRRQEDVSINLAPLIDVVFLLLIFFMVSTTFSKESHLRIHVPEASISEPSMENSHLLVVEISSRGDYAIQGPQDDIVRSLINRSPYTLRRALKEALGGRDDIVVVIRADRATPHESVIQVLDAARRADLRDITFATRQEKHD